LDDNALAIRAALLYANAVGYTENALPALDELLAENERLWEAVDDLLSMLDGAQMDAIVRAYRKRLGERQ